MIVKGRRNSRLKIKLLFILMMIIMLLFLINHFKYVPFEPISFDGEEYVIVNLNKKEYEKLAVVLDCYHIDFKIDKNIILVKNNLIKDKDLLLNFTNKAMDMNWKCPQIEKVEK